MSLRLRRRHLYKARFGCKRRMGEEFRGTLLDGFQEKGRPHTNDKEDDHQYCIRHSIKRSLRIFEFYEPGRNFPKENPSDHPQHVNSCNDDAKYSQNGMYGIFLPRAKKDDDFRGKVPKAGETRARLPSPQMQMPQRAWPLPILRALT